MELYCRIKLMPDRRWTVDVLSILYGEVPSLEQTYPKNEYIVYTMILIACRAKNKHTSPRNCTS